MQASQKIAPNKQARAKCWAARDSLWECLDQNSNDMKKCTQYRTDFESSCSRTWVKYFDRRRDYLKYKDKIQNEGFEPVKTTKS